MTKIQERRSSAERTRMTASPQSLAIQSKVAPNAPTLQARKLRLGDPYREDVQLGPIDDAQHSGGRDLGDVRAGRDLLATGRSGQGAREHDPLAH